MSKYPFYSVKVRNSSGATRPVNRTPTNTWHREPSFFIYDRFYLFHKEDMHLASRMFHLYLLHTITPIMEKHLTDFIFLEMVTSLGNTALTKQVVTKVESNDQQKSTIPWHVGRSRIVDYMLVVPTYAYNTAYSHLKKHKGKPIEHALGYVRSRSVSHVSMKRGRIDVCTVESIGEIPKLVIGKNVVDNPCVFCERYLDGFQAGTCTFGTHVCRINNTIFIPGERKTIYDDDVSSYGDSQV